MYLLGFSKKNQSVGILEQVDGFRAFVHTDHFVPVFHEPQPEGGSKIAKEKAIYPAG